MKKILLFIVIVGYSQFVFSQSVAFEELFKKNFLLNQTDTHILCDINNDSIADTIMNLGITPNAEGEFFQLSISSGKRILSEGVVYDTFMCNKKKGICVKQYPCCGGTIVNHLWCMIDSNNELYEIMRMSYVYPTMISMLNNGDSTIVKCKTKEKCVVRYSPYENNEMYDYDLNQRGNIVATIRNGAYIYCIDHMISSGEIWLFIAVDYEDCVDGVFDGRNNYILGWIKYSNIIIYSNTLRSFSGE